MFRLMGFTGPIVDVAKKQQDQNISAVMWTYTPARFFLPPLPCRPYPLAKLP